MEHQIVILTLITTTLSVSSIIYYYQQGLILAYGDAESHLNIAKRVVSSITPGFGQLGGNWLPLQHVMMLPFIWNDFLWRSGLAGSVVSMVSFILSTIFIFKLIKLVTNNSLASWVGSFIFITNPGIFYMQATPMGELPLIVMLIGSVYFMAKWAATNNILSLIFSAFLGFCGSLIRYDAWFLFIFEILAIVVIGLQKKLPFQKIKGVIILFSTVAALGILLWIIWNLLIFKDPLYFLLSPYSAKAQQLTWLARGELPSYHNFLSSLSFYTLATVKNTGILFFITACVGLLITLYKLTRDEKNRFALTGSTLLFTPLPFYVITLFLGLSIILIPELLPSSFRFNNFNVRYGLMMTPFVAVFTAILFTYLSKRGRLLLLLIIILQMVLFVKEGRPASLEDAVTGLSARRPSPVNEYVVRNYDYGLIMFDDFSRAANPVSLGVPMNKIIYVGNHPYWENALEHPTKYVRWFIIRHDENDVIWQKFKSNKEFLENYDAVYQSGKTVVYKRIDRLSSLKDPSSSASPPSFWKYQCIDTMKQSRDKARYWMKKPNLLQLVEAQLTEIKNMGANCVAIDTPYDKEFISHLTMWVNEARKKNLHVWLRGNWSSWEGWFGYPKGMTTQEHLNKTKQFILDNPDLFQDGDVFTPCPECENGGSFREMNPKKYASYRQFLIDEYKVTQNAFKAIGKNVEVNWFSMNGGLAKEVMDNETIESIGGVVTIDHYVKSPDDMDQIIQYFKDKLGAKIVIGEFGAPIPEINGSMTENEQAKFIDDLLEVMYGYRKSILGVNYWTLSDSSTALLNSAGSQRPVVEKIKKYFKPGIVRGTISNTLGEPLRKVSVKTGDRIISTTTDIQGRYAFILPARDVEIIAEHYQYKAERQKITVTPGSKTVQDIVLEPQKMSFSYRIKLLMQDIQKKLSGFLKKI